MSTPPTLAPTRSQTDPLRAGYEAIAEYVGAQAPKIRACSEDLYAHPELSGAEFRSSRKLAAIAEQAGFQVALETGGLSTAFLAEKAGGLGTDGPTVAYLAEYDALPDVGHGCGHNFIGTASTYAALALGAAAEKFRGRVLLIGTPAEETDGGKIDLQRAGVFENVDIAMMVHPASENDAFTVSLALVPALVRFRGKPAHAAACPWEGRNALDAMIQFFVMVEHLKKQYPLHARIMGVITKGGVRSNIVPELTEAEFSVRSTTREELARIYERFKECAQAAALATGCSVEVVEFGNRYDEMRTNRPLAENYHKHWEALGGVVDRPKVKHFGSIDIGNLSHDFPCIHPRVATADAGTAGHTVAFGDATITEHGHEVLLRCIQTMARVGLEYLLDEGLRASVRSDFEAGK